MKMVDESQKVKPRMGSVHKDLLEDPAKSMGTDPVKAVKKGGWRACPHGFLTHPLTHFSPMSPNRRIFLNIVATYGRSLYALVIGLFCGRWTLIAAGGAEIWYNMY